MGNFYLKPKKNRRGDSKTCLNSLFHTYRHQAKRREFIFELTKEQFAELTKQNCWYCGQEPAQITRITPHQRKCGAKYAYYLYNGIDRVNNEAGYTEANCVPCCGRCNHMKHVLHAENFIIHIRKIARNLNIF